MKGKIKITVVFYVGEKTLLSPFRSMFKEPQEKTFDSIDACIEWCRRNHEKIFSINDFRTLGEPMSHFDILDAINGKSR